MPRYVPKYVRPGEAAERRARIKNALIWTAAIIPIAFMFFAFGYSDQAPTFLRNAIIAVDRSLGYPIIWLLSNIVG